MLTINTVYQGDSLELMDQIDTESIDLIVTSPPYSNQRDYGGGATPEKYVEWFLPFTKKMLRILKSSGSFILNIKEKCVDGERSTYVMELILAMRQQGWRYKEEYCWRKTTSVPGYWNGRLRDGWERLIHFTKTNNIKWFPDNVSVPVATSTKLRAKHSSERDKTRKSSTLNPKFANARSKWEGKEFVHPDNVITCPPVHTNTGHPAAFPETLPEFFIKLLTEQNDIVLDPFTGSGTTCYVASRLNRQYIGIELSPEYVELANKRLCVIQPNLFDLADYKIN